MFDSGIKSFRATPGRNGSPRVNSWSHQFTQFHAAQAPVLRALKKLSHSYPLLLLGNIAPKSRLNWDEGG